MFDMREFGIEIKEEKEKFIYRRNGIEKVIFGKKIQFDLFPVAPSGISSYLYLKLKTPILIQPGNKIKFRITAPYDIEVRALKKGKWISIERIVTQNEKYALYGPIESGVLCRYFESDIGERENTAILDLSIENQTKEWQEINKIVFPINFDLSYDKKVHYPPFDLTLTSTGLVISKKDTLKGIKEIEKLINVQKKYTMLWGY